MNSQKAAGSFIKGATILTAAGILSRILGLFFKVPLYHMYGSYGNGIFYNVTNIYNFLLMVSTVGLPVAISKMVSENLARKDILAVKDTFKVSMITLLTVGGISTAILLFGAQFIINATGWPQDSFWSIIAIAPAPLIISACCAFRGYYQGFQIMNPTAISQIVEQIVRVILGLAICAYGIYVLHNIGIGVAGSVFGATAGGIAALLILLFVYPLFKAQERKAFRRIKVKKGKRQSIKRLFYRLLYIAIPVTLTSSIASLFSVFDSLMYIPRLAVAGINTDLATQLIGDYGNAELLINVPLVISGNLAVAFMPSISESFALKEKKVLSQKINLSIEVLVLVGLPCCVGLSTLAYGISDLLFPNSECGYYLVGYAYVTMFMMLGSTFQSTLQGIDKFKIPLITLGIGFIIREIVAYILLAVPGVDFYALILGSFSCFLFLTISNYYFVRKFCHPRLKWMKFLGFAFSSLIMGLAVYAVDHFCLLILPNAISVVLAVIAGIAVYFLMIILTNSLTPELLESIPGSSKLKPLYNKINNYLEEK